jgi:hypothetical protein
MSGVSIELSGSTLARTVNPEIQVKCHGGTVDQSSLKGRSLGESLLCSSGIGIQVLPQPPLKTQQGPDYQTAIGPAGAMLV